MSQISPDGLWKLDPQTNSWVPNTPPAPPPPPPPPNPYIASGQPQNMSNAAPPPPFIPQAPVPYAQAPAGGSDDYVTSADVAWEAGHKLGDGFVVLIEDIEGGTSQKDNPTLKFSGKTLQPCGAVAAGYKSQWSYTLTFDADGKKGGIGKLGKDLNRLGISRFPNPRKVGTGELAQALLNGRTYPDGLTTPPLRGATVILNVKERSGSEFPNIDVVGPYTQAAAPAAPAYTAPVAPPAAAPAAPPPGYAIGFPAAPPPPPAPGASAFHSV